MAIVEVVRSKTPLKEFDEVWVEYNNEWYPGKITVVEKPKELSSFNSRDGGPIVSDLRHLSEVGYRDVRKVVNDYKVRLDNKLRSGENPESLWVRYYNPSHKIAVETHGPFKRLGYGIAVNVVVDGISMVGAVKLIVESLKRTHVPWQAALAINIFNTVWSVPVGVVGTAQFHAGVTESEFRGRRESVTLTTAGIANIVSAVSGLAANTGDAIGGYQGVTKVLGPISTAGWTVAQICDFVNALASALKLWNNLSAEARNAVPGTITKSPTMTALKSPEFVDVIKTLITTAGGAAIVISAFPPFASAAIPALGSAAFIGSVLQVAGGIVIGGPNTIRKKVKVD